MELNVEKMAEILNKDEGVSMGIFDLNNKPAVGALFARPEHIPVVRKFAEDLIEKQKLKTLNSKED